MPTQDINTFAVVTPNWAADYLFVSVGGTVGPRKALLTAAGLGVVPTTRTVTAGTNLTGGGALSGDITLNVAASPTFTNVVATTFSGSGAALTSLSGSNVTAGTVAPARLGTGGTSSTYLRGDSTFTAVVTAAVGTTNQVSVSAATGSVTFSLPQSIHTAADVVFNSTRLTAGVEAHGTTRQLGSVAFGMAVPDNMPVGLKVLSADSTITTLDKTTATLADVIDAVAALQRQNEYRGLYLPVADTPAALFVAQLGYLWQDAAGTIPATTAGDPVGRWDSALSGLPYASQSTSGLRPVLALDGSGRLEVRDAGSGTSYLSLSSNLIFTGDCTLYARGTQTNYSTVWAPYTGADEAKDFSDNQNYLTAASGGATVGHACIIKGQLKVRWRRASGTAYLMGHGTTEITGVDDASMGSLAGTITFSRIAGVNSVAGNGVSLLAAFARNLSLDDRAKTDLAAFGTIQN